MNLKELGDIYFKASTREPSDEGIAAVVRALRGKIGEAHCAGQHHQIGDHPVDVDTSVANSWSLSIIHEILGSDVGNEKAAGGEAVSGDGLTPRSSMPASTPAADPSEVCVWIADGYSNLDGTMWVDCEGLRRWLKSRSACPSCGKPIKFQEQQP